MPANVFIAQSGGPSAVINNSLRGVLDVCRENPSVFGQKGCKSLLCGRIFSRQGIDADDGYGVPVGVQMAGHFQGVSPIVSGAAQNEHRTVFVDQSGLSPFCGRLTGTWP